MYGEDADRILEANKQADELAKKAMDENKKNKPYKYSAEDEEFILQCNEIDIVQRVRATCYEHLLKKELDKNKIRTNIEAPTTGRSERNRSRIITSPFLIDKNRKLNKTRNFLWKLRNERIKTMQKMHLQKEAVKKENSYTEKVLKKIQYLVVSSMHERYRNNRAPM